CKDASALEFYFFIGWDGLPADVRAAILAHRKPRPLRVEVVNALPANEDGSDTLGQFFPDYNVVAFAWSHIRLWPADLLLALIAHELGHAFLWAAGGVHRARWADEDLVSGLARSWGFNLTVLYKHAGKPIPASVSEDVDVLAWLRPGDAA